MCADEFRASSGDTCAFLRLLQIISAGVNEGTAFDHDEMLVGNERRVSGTVFRDDAAAIGKPKEHAMPLKILLIGVMNVEQNFRTGEQGVAFHSR